MTSKLDKRVSRLENTNYSEALRDLDKEEVLVVFRHELEIPLVGIYWELGPNATFYLIIETPDGTDRVKIGSSSALHSIRKVKIAFFNHTGKSLPDISRARWRELRTVFDRLSVGYDSAKNVYVQRYTNMELKT